MKFIFVNQYYPPGLAPTGRYLKELAEHLAGLKHDVTVICSNSSYRGEALQPEDEIINGVRVKRLPGPHFSVTSGKGALINSLSFHCSLKKELAKYDGTPDLIVAMSSPPLIGLSVRKIARRRKWKYGHWVMNMLPGNMCSHLEKKQFKGSVLILTIGMEMADKLQSLGVTDPHYVPLWAQRGVSPLEESEFASGRKKCGWNDDELVMMYSGNMGIPHRFDDIEEAARQTADDKTVRWVFSGDGKRRRQVAGIAGGSDQAEIHPYVPAQELSLHLGLADVHLVTLGQSWNGCAVPCKVHDVMMAGRPVIFVGPRNNSIARWIRESEAGWLVREGDVDALLGAVSEAKDNQARTEMGKRARAFAEKHFSGIDAIEKVSVLVTGAAQA